ncbi:MAG: hypothetical protein U9O50_08460 [Acidobacteriota bacterium]|nr:hypothetical protein [Acidobacteriota bacterium]
MGKEEKKNPKVFQTHCPICNSLLWIDPVKQEVIKHEQVKKKKSSLDELLLEEKERKDKFDRKFEATAELEKEKLRKAEEKFKKALHKIGDDEADKKD